jgi:hypothetical protein
VRVRQYDMGRIASEMLLDRLAGKEPPSAEPTLFPVELVVRNSCGAKRMSKEQISGMLDHLLQSDLVDLSGCKPAEQ